MVVEKNNVKVKLDMKKLNQIGASVICAMSVLLSFSANAFADDKLTPAESKLLNESIKICLSDAKEDKVTSDELIDYLVICVTDELEINDGKQMTQDHLVKVLKQSKLVKPIIG